MSSETPNPYQPPTPSPFADRPDSPLGYTPPPRSSNFVGQVRIVCILMLVQGGLELLMGLFYAGFAIFFPVMMSTEMQKAQRGANGPDPETMMYVMGGVYGTMALFTIVPGVLHIVAGIKNWKFKSRTLGIVALASGAATILTCYCGITGIALCVYGLIVFLNWEVAQAFAMGQAGHKPAAILAAFGAGPPVPPADQVPV